MLARLASCLGLFHPHSSISVILPAVPICAYDVFGLKRDDTMAMYTSQTGAHMFFAALPIASTDNVADFGGSRILGFNEHASIWFS